MRYAKQQKKETMADRMLRSEIVGEVRRAMREVVEQMEERWLTPDELSKQFAFFSKDWIRHYGHLLPRERVNVTGDGVDASTRWAYPMHKINRMVSEGAFRELQWKSALSSKN